MTTYSASHRVTGSGHPLNGRLGGHCRGLVARVPLVTGDGPKIQIRSVPSNSKWLGDHTPCIEYGPPLLAKEDDAGGRMALCTLTPIWEGLAIK
jgi:hypothetical protein